MPTYVYRCLDCRQEYEKREGFDAPALQQCPSCDGTSRRVIHAAPIVFKGSGFYVTDSRKGAASDGERPTSTPEAEAAATDKPSKSDGSSKPAEPAAAS
jgi:putative FmdB family regulatory protein